MSQTMHVVRKDARRLRWVLVLFLAVLAARVFVSLNGAGVTGDPVRSGLVLQELSSAMVMMELLMTALIVARLVHEEPLVGFAAFWFTRPYDVADLVRAKLLFSAVILVGLPLVADLTTLALLDAGPQALVRAASTASVVYASSVLALMVIATLTPSLGVFVLTLLGIAAGTSMLLLSVVGLAPIWGSDETARYSPPGTPDATRGLVMLAVYLCAALGIVMYQYRHRRWRVATVLTVGGLAATLIVPVLWPWSFARGEEIRPGPWAADATIVHDPSWGTKMSDMTRFGRGAPRREVGARVILSGTPPQVTVPQTGGRSRLQLADGTVIESGLRGGSATPFRADTVEAALGGVQVLAFREVYEQGWTSMITLAEDEYTRHRGRSGRLEADVYFELQRTREVGSLPVTPGAALDDGVSRLEIIDVQRRSGGRDVVMRRWSTQSLLAAERSPDERLFALRHRSRREALMGGVETQWTTGRRGNAAIALLRLPFAMLGAGFGISGESAGGGFSAGTTFLRFPGPGYGKAPPLDEAWFDQAELVVLHREWAGVLRRRLFIEKFIVPEN